MSREVIRKHGSLEIDEDPGFQNVTWAVERVAWAVLALVLLAALAGVFGHGPLSRGQARTEGLEIDYPRVARLDSAEDLTLRFRPRNPITTIRLNGDFSSKFVVENVLPEPVRQQTHGGGLSLDFATSSAEADQVVVMHLRPRGPAFPARGHVGLRDGEAIEISTVVLP